MLEREWSEDRVLEKEEDGRLVLEVTAKRAPEVIGWGMGFGREAELLEPRAPRDQLQVALQQAIRPYESPAQLHNPSQATEKAPVRFTTNEGA